MVGVDYPFSVEEAAKAETRKLLPQLGYNISAIYSLLSSSISLSLTHFSRVPATDVSYPIFHFRLFLSSSLAAAAAAVVAAACGDWRSSFSLSELHPPYFLLLP